MPIPFPQKDRPSTADGPPFTGTLGLEPYDRIRKPQTKGVRGRIALPESSTFETVAKRLQERLASLQKPSEAIDAAPQEAWRLRFKTQLPDIVTFCDKWLRQPLYPGPQTDFAVACFGTDPLRWRGGSKFNRAKAKWGKRGGKDSTFGKIFTYANAWIVNLHSPWEYFQKPDGDPIDMINVSYNATQARNVFFKYLKGFMRRTRNPVTGRNFFEEMGLDLREGGRSFQTRKVVLNDRKTASGEDTISCWSGDSKEITGEGKNILMSALDELGAFPSVEKAINLHDALLETAVATYGEHALVAAASYVYSKNDAMCLLYEKDAPDEKLGLAYRSTYATWDANPGINRERLETLRRQNPRRFARVYECKLEDSENQFIKPSEEVRGQCNRHREWPTMENIWRCTNPLDLKFKDWFKGVPGTSYHIHVDLATGKEGRDKAGLVMGRRQRKRPAYSEAYLQAMGMGVDKPLPEMADSVREGVYLDLLLQIFAPPGGEISFAAIIDFIRYLRDERHFAIVSVSYDGWQSVGEIQRLQAMGFIATQLSVDKTNEPAETTKELLVAGLLDYYSHPVFLREGEELVYNDKDKVDHPERSNLREQEEGDPRGSKDVWDAGAGTVSALLTGNVASSYGGEDPWFAA